MGLLDLLTDALESLEVQAQKGFAPYAQKPAQSDTDIDENGDAAPAIAVSPQPARAREAYSPLKAPAQAAPQAAARPFFSSSQIASGIVMAEILSRPVSKRRGRGRYGLED